MSDVQVRSSGVIIAFPEPSANRPRSPLGDTEPRGEILLFTGVRYERMEPRPASDGTKRRRRS